MTYWLNQLEPLVYGTLDDGCCVWWSYAVLPHV
jgi:hypothetical protein